MSIERSEFRDAILLLRSDIAGAEGRVREDIKQLEAQHTGLDARVRENEQAIAAIKAGAADTTEHKRSWVGMMSAAVAAVVTVIVDWWVRRQ